MAYVKKVQLVRRCAISCIIFGFLGLFVAYILLKSFLWAYLLLLTVVSVATVNMIFSYHGKQLSKLRPDWKHSELMDSVVMLISKYGLALTIGVCIYYVIAVLFGAPVFESYADTLLFGCLMTMLTVYPLCLYHCLSDNGLVGIIRIFAESKCDNMLENYFYTIVTWSVIGTWFGAFPIPLDWDRPWQVWPTPCCIGATLGYAASHLFMGFVTLGNSYKEKRHFSWNIFV